MRFALRPELSSRFRRLQTSHWRDASHGAPDRFFRNRYGGFFFIYTLITTAGMELFVNPAPKHRNALVRGKCRYPFPRE